MDTAKDTPAEQHRMEKEDIEDLGTVTLSRGGHVIHCLTVIGQIEGHTEAPQGQKTTKYEHVIPQLVAVQEDPRIEGLLVLLNTVGGDVETGLALAELIASISKPSATLVLGGGHSIGIPLAVSARVWDMISCATSTAAGCLCTSWTCPAARIATRWRILRRSTRSCGSIRRSWRRAR